MNIPNWKNRTIFRNDNLNILRGMNSESVDLIATDPPFNAKRDFHAKRGSLAEGQMFEDRWKYEENKHLPWQDGIAETYPAIWHALEASIQAHGQGMTAFLIFQTVRILEMHRILKPSGSITLHCDQTAVHYLKVIMDAVFGSRNFINDIIWQRDDAKSNGKHCFPRITDNILFYTKDRKAAFFDPQYTPYTQAYIEKHYPHTDPDGRRWKASCLTMNGTGDPSSNCYYDLREHLERWDWEGSKDKYLRQWKWKKETMSERADIVVQLADRAVPRYKNYLDMGKGVMVCNLWTDTNRIGAQSNEDTGYATQKPLDVYERIINAMCPPDGIVLDPFAGCATTCVAAERLGRQWVGIDINEGTKDILAKRMETDCPSMIPTQIIKETSPPKRTDNGWTTAEFVETPKSSESKRKGKSQGEGYYPTHVLRQMLADRTGCRCESCGWAPTDGTPELLQCGHNTPRSGGGSDHISNRFLACAICNVSIMKDRYTLKETRKLAKKAGLTKGPVTPLDELFSR